MNLVFMHRAVFELFKPNVWAITFYPPDILRRFHTRWDSQSVMSWQVAAKSLEGMIWLIKKKFHSIWLR